MPSRGRVFMSGHASPGATSTMVAGGIPTTAAIAATTTAATTAAAAVRSATAASATIGGATIKPIICRLTTETSGDIRHLHRRR